MNQDVHVPMSPHELPGKGKVIAFMPLIPGSGATTLALYAVFSLMAGQREIAVADLTPWGKARTYLGLLPQDYPASILDVLEHEEDEDITRFGVLHPFGFFVYPGVIRRLDAVLELGPDPTVGMRIAGVLKRAFDVTVLILPPLEASGWAGGMIADHVYLVVPPQRVALDVYADVMAALERFGMRGRVTTILNLLRKPGTMEAEDAVQEIRPFAALPYDPRVEEAANRRRLDGARRFQQAFRRALGTHLREVVKAT